MPVKKIFSKCKTFYSDPCLKKTIAHIVIHPFSLIYFIQKLKFIFMYQKYIRATVAHKIALSFVLFLFTTFHSNAQWRKATSTNLASGSSPFNQ